MYVSFAHLKYAALVTLLGSALLLTFSYTHAQNSGDLALLAEEPIQEDQAIPNLPPPPERRMPEVVPVVLQTQSQDRIINLSANITARLSAATDRLLNITERLKSRINKIQAEGVDTQPAYEKLLIAEARLYSAKEILTSGLPISSMVRGDKPRESFEQIRMQFVMTHGLIQEAKGILGDTITMLRTMPKSAPTENAETLPEQSTN